MKKISILIPCYNEVENVEGISAAVEKVLKQDLSQYDYEIVFIDNASNDGTRAKIEEICSVINSVSFSKNRGKKPETLEGKIVQDADRLDAMGAIGIARTFAFGGEHGRSIEESVMHFHEKLLLLKDEMNTESARKIAESRHAFLEEFLSHYYEEIKSE